MSRKSHNWHLLRTVPCNNRICSSLKLTPRTDCKNINGNFSVTDPSGGSLHSSGAQLRTDLWKDASVRPHLRRAMRHLPRELSDSDLEAVRLRSSRSPTPVCGVFQVKVRHCLRSEVSQPRCALTLNASKQRDGLFIGNIT